jgi:receptor protein-tyrosine kinase
MAGSPKPSLVERLVQDRLRSGELEASAAQLLKLGEGGSADAARMAAGEALPGAAAGDTGMNLLVRPPPIVTLRGAAAPGSPAAAELTYPASVSPGPATIAPAPDRANPSAIPFDSIPLEAIPLQPIALDASLGGRAAAAIPSALVPPALVPPALVPTALVPPALVPPALVPPAPTLRVDLARLPGQPAPAWVPPPVTGRQNAASPAVALPLELPLQSDHLPAPELLAQTTTGRAAEWSGRATDAPSIDAVALERGGMVDWSRTRSRISEEFRLVQRQILRSAFGPGAEPGFSNLLLVTSARPGEGKSFTALNLAGSIARQGDNHVLLVDADSKRDSICFALGLAENRGLLDLVANPKLDPSPLIVKTPIDRLSILPVGRERERSAELFSTKEMTRLIQSLGRRYADRLLILDAPPCLSTSDPAVLAPVVGQILFVVEADRTQRDEVEASLDLIQACPNITLVLNKQQISSRYTFGAYSSYYSS